MAVGSGEARWADEARGRLRLACVTGTNGKTSTVSMIAAIVAASGEPAGRVTTVGTWIAGRCLGEDVTREAFVEAVRVALDAGVRTLAVETTSKALQSGFAKSWPPRAAVFTNLTRDHLDFHGTVEQYLAAKAQLFLALPAGGTAVLNAADPSAALLAEMIPPGAAVVSFAARPRHPACGGLPVRLAARAVRVGREGTEVDLEPSGAAEPLGGVLRLGVLGEFQADNALAAALAAESLGFSPAAIRAGLESFAGVPGRFEVVAREPLVVIDYAHTPDALARTLDTARAVVAADGGRVICVFGCGGDRDRGKRPLMGAVAAASADVVVLTTDNPRSEEPGAIADAIEAGRAGGRAEWVREIDRALAIVAAVARARPRDVVVVAGKGHERFQIGRVGPVPFSDADEARRAVVGRNGRIVAPCRVTEG
jgi:UDP-N-acetylmuramoyl-L-alanyl-D-glutamate--2,6-diaminopimelate ligase